MINDDIRSANLPLLGGDNSINDVEYLQNQKIDEELQQHSIFLNAGATMTTFPLRHYLAENSLVAGFLYIMMIDWSFHQMTRWVAWFVGIYYVGMTAFIVSVLVVMFTYVVHLKDYVGMVGDDQVTLGLTLSAYFFAITTVTQLFSGMVCNYYCALRLDRPSLCAELNYIVPVSRQCLLFTIIFCIDALVGGILDYWGKASDAALSQYVFAITIFTLVTCGFVVASMFFVLVDAHISRDILLELIDKASNQLLQMDELEAARDEITRRVNTFYVPTFMMCFDALICTVTFVIALFETKGSNVGLELVSTAWYFKEVVFLFVVLYQSAKLNQLANELQLLLGKSHWVETKELRRIQLCINLQAEPISFTMLGMRPTLKSVAWQIGSVSIAVAVSLLRGILWF